MDCAFRGKVAIVTGAGRGIGREIAIRFGRAQATVVLAARSHGDLLDVAATITSEGGTALAIPTDVTDFEAVNHLVAETTQQFRRVDILVNNAAVNYVSNLILSDNDQWKHVFEVNVFGTYLCTKAILPHMIRARSGRIVSISSVAGKIGAAYNSAYSASKAAMIGFTKSVSLEVAALGITVNAICPWHVDTEMMREAMAVRAALFSKAASQYIQEIAATNPSRRLVSASEVAGLTLFLCGPDAAGITGQALNQCGGMVRE
jgi:NAD(P)-dependent dehydrogenase (short-subunit alcohol dehydrogenase family)